MLIWNDVDAVPMDWPASVVTIGVFDGVHRGHRELIRHAVSRAAVLGVPSVVVTFSPNPELAKRFMAFTAGPEGQAIFRRWGFLDNSKPRP